MFPFSPLTTDWKEITQWLVNVSWLYPILQWGRTSGKRHSEPKALNPWTRGRVQSATDAEEVKARSLSREILIRARASWGRPSHFSPTQEFLAAEGVLSVQGRVSVNKPPSPGHPHPHPTPQQLQGTVWRTEQGETALSQALSGQFQLWPSGEYRQTKEGRRGLPWRQLGVLWREHRADINRQGKASALTPTTKELTFHTDLLDPRGIHKSTTLVGNWRSLHPTLPAPDITAFRDQKPGHSPLNLGDIHLRNHKMECLPLHKASSRPDNPFPRMAVGARRTFVGPDCDPKSTKLASVTPRVCARSQGRSVPTGRNKGCRFCRGRRGEEGGRGRWQRRAG